MAYPGLLNLGGGREGLNSGVLGATVQWLQPAVYLEQFYGIGSNAFGTGLSEVAK